MAKGPSKSSKNAAHESQVDHFIEMLTKMKRREGNYSTRGYKHECTICEFNSSSVEALRRHMAKTHGHCEECEFQSSNYHEVVLHLHQTHGDMFGCMLCTRCPVTGTTVTPVQLCSHMKADHEAVWHQCKYCLFATLTQQDLLHHTETEHVRPCKSCDFHTDELEKYHTHMQRHHPCGRTCKCGARFSSYQEYKQHMDGCDKVETFHCPRPNCYYSTKKKSNFQRHKETHDIDENKFKCEQCNWFRDAVNKDQLTEHMVYKHGLRFRCDQCVEFEAVSQQDLKKHIAMTHWKCGICGFQACNQSSHKQHIKTHNKSEQLLHSCEEPGCNYKTLRQRDLKRHKTTVHGVGDNIKYHNCFNCNKQFTRKDKFVQHLKSMRCKNSKKDDVVEYHHCVCNRRFTRKDNYKRHLNSCKEFLRSNQ